MDHRLAVILYADVAGYSRLTGVDEEGTHQNLNAGLDQLTSTIDEAGGRAVHEAGDAILAEFNSTVTALQCAADFQRSMATQDASVDDENRLTFRIGINLGEVIDDRDDIYGDGVNIAARLQEIAEPGGICVSGAVFEQISGRTDHKFDDLGYRKLKNISQPVRIYQIRFTEAHSGTETHTEWPHLAARKDRHPVTSGRCLCGDVRYEVWDEPAGVGCWEPGARDEVSWWDGGSFHENLCNSNGLQTQPRKYIDIVDAPNRVKEIHEINLPHFEHMYAYRLGVPTLASDGHDPDR